jgi:hypothetical protein
LTRAGVAKRAPQIVDDSAQRTIADVRIGPELLAQLSDARQLAWSRDQEL